MVKIKYLGHSVVAIETEAVKLIIDPFLEGNPQATISPSEIDVDVICVTHGHADHIGDTVEIAKRNHALVIAPFELATFLDSKGCNVHPMHIGGSRTFEWGQVKLTPALHGSGLPDENGNIVYLGNPCGFLITVEGKTIYHAGDTGLSSEMEMIGRMNQIDVAFLPIGDNFTMGANDATEAVKMLKPKVVVPMHYSTWEIINQDPLSFRDQVGESACVEVIAPGGTFNI